MDSAKNQKKELQTRREFFKTAAKTVLPILGAIVVASNPIVGKAAEEMGCTSSCYNSCKGTCTGCTSNCSQCCTGCSTACQSGCATGCSGGCTGCNAR